MVRETSGLMIKAEIDPEVMRRQDEVSCWGRGGRGGEGEEKWDEGKSCPPTLGCKVKRPITAEAKHAGRA